MTKDEKFKFFETQLHEKDKNVCRTLLAYLPRPDRRAPSQPAFGDSLFYSSLMLMDHPILWV